MKIKSVWRVIFSSFFGSDLCVRCDCEKCVAGGAIESSRIEVAERVRRRKTKMREEED